jgi:hypothetical protein
VQALGDRLVDAERRATAEEAARGKAAAEAAAARAAAAAATAAADAERAERLSALGANDRLKEDADRRAKAFNDAVRHSMRFCGR